ncbi:glycosyl transferase family 90 [Thaumasiovibrio subtropicus]|uniref:glycosyl transferase family 90 n=1 Tax=Thaumasiovibrio subtropicus TaxID=1891207 RepID=UPI000B35D99F|nr:glycosyl transferase family 90 [Thaumasiovibrio subtropicus]
MKVFYYLKHIGLALLPHSWFTRRQRKLEQKFADQQDYIQRRVDYYLKTAQPFTLAPEETTAIADYTRRGFTSYFYDLKEYLHYFPKQCRFAYYFGDETHIEPRHTLFKARPIAGDNERSVIFKLDKRRHFRFVEDTLSFAEKKPMAVFRGAVTQPHRIRFMETLFGHPLVDAGQSNPSETHPEWQQPFMSVEDQLQYKFLFALEGNDVASNLKWAMSSNSLVFTPKMVFETWFMEGTLQAGVHYVEVKDDFSDVEEKINYYLAHPEKAQQIIDNAHAYLAPYQNPDLEDLVCIKVLERYFSLSGQLEK